ncbi:replication initiation and membrane attachment family protein [Bacillus luteolus]|uniref:Replication initiation and membrane attachment family protein n=1 Tax=Litchfieldia luteola TaxID=682179 RepID=A0ABR9QIA2_9BACI|nr:replication initiation and membrane attachment family protein [Cytobacillus luteolus]MBE4908228.1 replication initiation and membrane attachment family protein [Cytobacillus luteolus]MBP1943014.1 replication initiation and membrane attachment protein [Cytobacillus luteolus]
MKQQQHWKDLLPIDRYIVRSADMLNENDRKVLTLLYQPLIGTKCFSLYMTLWSELEQNRMWGEETTHHGLMAIMQTNLRDIYQERLKLEAIGLMKTFVNESDDNRLFIYDIQAPLTPKEFFTDGVLNIFLYNRLGKNKFMMLKRFFSGAEIDSQNFKPITKNFNEVFSSINPSEMAVNINEETTGNTQLDQNNSFFDRQGKQEIHFSEDLFDFDLFFAGISEVMIPKKSITPKVQDAIKKLSFLYSIDPIQMQNIAMSAINHNEMIDIEKLRKAARDWYQFEHGDHLPALSERSQPIPYQTMATREPESKEEKLIKQLETISPRALLIDISGGAEPSSADMKIIEDVMFGQQLLPGVVNVLIYYVMLRSDMKLTKGYVEKLASHWSRKQIRTVPEAMTLAKQEHRQYQNWAKTKSEPKQNKRKAVRTEMLPDWLHQETSEKQEESSQKDFEHEKRELEERIKKFKKKT